MLSSYTYTPADVLTDLRTSRRQSTLSRSFAVEGIGLFTGIPVRMVIRPAPEGHGIVFKRTDLAEAPLIPALVENVLDTPRCTILCANGAQVQTVEHVLSALRAYNIDNAMIELSGPEAPAADGSALHFVEQINQVGIEVQEAQTPVRTIDRPLYWSEGDIHIVAVPCDEYRISYTLSYPGHPLLDAQFYSTTLTPEIFEKEIASSRTFSLYEEITPLLERGLIKGGSLDNGVIIKGKEILNPEGIRFPNEMVRHKVLDLIGDLSLVGLPFTAHIFAVRSGHFANSAFAKKLREYFDQTEC